MAAEFKILVGADLDAAVKSINDFVKTTKNGFGNIDAAVLASTNEFKKLQSELSRSKDPAAIAVLQKRLQELATQLSTQVPQAAAKTAKAVDVVGKVSLQTTAQVNGLNNAAAKTAQGANNLQGSSNRASFAVLNLGRIAQDSAFGFIGIANNIEPFIQSLTALRRESTSAKGALGAFFGSLAGPAGIGLVIGAISLFDAWSNGYGIFASKNKEANKEQEYTSQILKKVNIEYADQTELLKAVTAAQIASTKAGADQLSIYNALSEGIRKYITNLGKQELVKEILPQYNKIVAVGVEAQKQLERINLGLELYDPEEEAIERKRIAQAIAITEKQVINAQKLFNKIGGGAKGLASILGVDDGKVVASTQAATKSVNDLAAATKELNAAAVETLKFLPIGSIAQLNKEIQALRGQQELTFDPVVFQNYQAEIDAIALKIKEIQGGIALPDIDSNEAGLKNFTVTMDAIVAKADTTKTATQQAVASINSALESIAVNSVVGFAETLGTALGSGDITGGIRRFAGVIGQAVTSLGVQVVAVSKAMVALQAALSSGIFAGPLGLAAGIGLIVAGAALSSLASGGLKLARGGVVASPTQALIGDGGPEAVIPLSQLANIIGGVAMQMGGGSGGGLSIVRGQDIYYSNNNASRSFGRLFG